MKDVRGVESANTPVEFIMSHNWIDVTRPSKVIFVTLAPEKVNALISNLKKYIHEDDIPPLIKIEK